MCCPFKFCDDCRHMQRYGIHYCKKKVGNLALLFDRGSFRGIVSGIIGRVVRTVILNSVSRTRHLCGDVWDLAFRKWHGCSPFNR